MTLTTRLALASLLMAGPAAAADLTMAEPVVAVPVEAPINFTGFTVGGFLGAAYSDGQADLGAYDGSLIRLDVSNGLFPQAIDDSDTSFLGGVSVGYNHQFGQFVAGVEADISWLDLNPRAGLNLRDPNPDPQFNGVQTITSYETEVEALGTVRARLGMAFDQTLVYATGGLAIGDVKNRFALAIPEFGYNSPDWSTSDTLYGYVVGGGIEHKLTQSISVRAEGLYYDLENTTVYASDPVAFPGQRISYGFDNDGFIGRIGLAYSF
ncbi:outer membrane protein [Aureimonas phyllosphaerae]|uniref:outer membrane protein n=1 Tax=Aureimonas phyllosphaerae TaxID=1166078 RepID=UPI003A5BD33A